MWRREGIWWKGVGAGGLGADLGDVAYAGGFYLSCLR